MSLELRYRVLDLVIVVAMAPFVIPILGLIICGLFLAQGSPVFFSCKRVGPHGTFSMYKFRSMIQNAPLLETTEAMNVYVTPVGRLIRRLSLDELPQIMNVAMGSMSLVGPRPCLPSQSDLIEMRKQRGLDLYSPGLTGLAQVRGRDFISIKQKVRYEQFYASKRSVALYFWILGVTVKTAFSGRGIKY